MVALVAGTALGWVGTSSPALADTGESIRDFEITYDIGRDGAVSVTEHVRYDFGTAERHGIERIVPTRERADETHDRVYRITDVQVESPTGAPDTVLVDDRVTETSIRVGDPDQTITGVHDYVLRYQLEGALNSQPGHDELYWDAVGSEWRVPIENASVTVTAPGGLERVTCYAGHTGSRDPCESAVVDSPRRASFRQADLAPGEALTVVVGLRTGVVTVPPPELVDAADDAFSADAEARPAGPLSYAVAAAVAVGAVTFVGVVYWRRGRDQHYLGLTPGLEPLPGEPVRRGPVGLFGKPPVAVEFTPPAGVGPGVAGTLLDERADTLDVSATIVDLAVRGYLHIEELPPAHFWSARDWRLTRRTPPEGGELSAAEQHLLTALFGRDDEVLLSDLKYRFAQDLRTVQRLFYEEAVQRGWFHRRPDRVRRWWKLAGAALAVVGVVLLAGPAGEASGPSFAVIGIALLVAGAVFFLSARAMPGRTPAGSAMMARIRGFQLYLQTAEAGQLRFEEGEDIFSRYLPYAMVFGITERWATVFAELGRVPDQQVSWYSGPQGFNARYLGVSLGHFASSAERTLSAVRSSASGGSGFSGGFSGGGGGGGGGGSW